MPFKTFSITNGERLDTDLSSYECITRKRGEAVDVVGWLVGCFGFNDL